MIFYAREESMGVMPRAEEVDRKEKWRLKISRVGFAVVCVAVLIVVFVVLVNNGYPVLAEIVRTAGELLAGGLVGVFFSERQSSRIINIYISEARPKDDNKRGG